MKFDFFTSPLARRKALWLAATIALAFIALASHFRPQRVGDGSEYYAMYGTIIHGHRTYMTPQGWDAYDKLVRKGRITAMVDTDTLRHTFPSLIQQSGSDFNHFWMYPGLAAVAGGWTLFVHAKAHMGFMILHAILLGCLVFVAARSFGWAGPLAVFALIAGSPLLWFIDKVHTEFFTFCCVAIASTLIFQKRNFASAAWLALASTQNISIGASAVLMLSIAVWNRRDRGFSPMQVCMIGLTLALIAIHPVYYFFRVGVIDPQLLAGGAKIGANVSTMYAWFFDPDVGLFTNWPLGLVFVLCILVAIGRKHLKLPGSFVAFLLVFIATNLYAQSSTENLNSGATIDVARYGLWYVGLFLPLLASLLVRRERGQENESKTSSASSRAGALVVTALTLCSIAYGSRQFNPSRAEHYLEPTPLSRWIQAKHPTWYTPPDQIFVDRNAGQSSASLPPSYAVAGPECRKFLVVERGNAPVQPVAKDWCGLDLKRLPDAIFHPEGNPRMGTDGSRIHTVILSEADLVRAKARFLLDHTYSMSTDSVDGAQLLGAGWNTREAWGVWSEGSTSVLTGIAPQCTSRTLTIDLEVNPFLTPKNRVIEVGASVNGTAAGTYRMSEASPATLRFQAPCTAIVGSKTLTISFQIKGAISPKTAYGVADARVLGIGLKSFRLTASDSDI
ncbi:hypothetical protein J2T07_002816 [Luteibacter jiangsuensis]|uniref:Membrane protein DUF2079 n=1 Tax=Luteibacter jiangsuensis TaxID=637577 RepID=A0ABT9T022_9GAMM|nr:hypothetical protein [Luteibacter jiangsuensis]MDQ0010610.1 hypothetical protein [Luteibacter jiangsuensis]